MIESRSPFWTAILLIGIGLVGFYWLLVAASTPGRVEILATITVWGLIGLGIALRTPPAEKPRDYHEGGIKWNWSG